MIRPEEVELHKKSGAKAYMDTDGNRAGVLLRRLIADALGMRATDIHLGPDGDRVRVRARVDGFLRDLAQLDGESGGRLVSAIKILCDLDISRRNPTQDGSFSAMVQGRRVEFRVSTLEEVGGETMALRILESLPETMDLKSLGMNAKAESEMRSFLARSHGMLVVSGPTGSGKSTTLYALLREVDRRRRQVIAIEDPVEYRLEYVTHVPVNVKGGLTFATALRNALRQDPNILMIGEIRDAETAGIAIQSGLTGHLVLTSLHARDALGTVNRLKDLGVSPMQISEVLNFSLAQRLVRRLCTSCRKPADEGRVRAHPLGKLVKSRVWEPGGCEHCGGTGYRSRLGIFELVKMSDRLRELIAAGSPESELRKAAAQEGSVPILAAAMDKVNEGLTSIEEVERVLL